MSSILIKNANLISVSANRNKIERNVDILIKGGKISKIGIELNDSTDQVIKANNRWIIPGLINCHCHIPMSLFREIVDGYKLQKWLTEAIWPIEDKMTKEDIYYFSLLSMLESIESGVTTINDMYFETEQIINAAEKAKINAVLGITLMDINGEKAGNKRIKNFGKLIEEFPNANISTLIHGLYTNSPKYLEKALAFGKKHNKNLVHMHFCENSDEVKTICEAYDVKHPGEVLEKYFKGLKLVLAHCVKIDSYTMKTLAKMNANVVHNPISNLRLGCGFADLKTMQEMNINICLGTDGQGSGSNMGILESMRLACLLPKGVNEDPTIITAYDALKMGTINGAKALGLEERKGSIDIGKDADLVFLNLEGTKTYPINDVVSDIVYNATESNIETVIINGKIVLKNKVHVKVNKKELLAKCAKLANDIKKR